MRYAILFVLLGVLHAQTVVSTGGHRKVFGCSAPAATDRWVVGDAGSLCGAGVSCTNGAGLAHMTDIGSAGITNTAMNQAVSGDQPTYITGAVNGLPAATFVKANSTYLQSVNAINLGTSMTLWSVLKVNTAATTNASIIAGNPSGSLEFGVQANSGLTAVNLFATNQTVNIGNSAVSYPYNTYMTVAFTYNSSTGAFSFYQCSAGTCNLVTSGTNAQSVSSLQRLGAALSSVDYFNGSIAEWGYRNTIDLTGIATWSQCRYGI